MGKRQHVKNLLQRFTDNTISKSEFEELSNLIEQSHFDDEIEDSMIQQWEKINLEFSSNDTINLSGNDELFESILEKIENSKQVKKPRLIRNTQKWYRLAAIFILLLGLGYFYFNPINPNPESLLKVPTEKITLIMGNGDIKVISEKENILIANHDGLVIGTQTGNTIAYKKDTPDKTLTYNTLSVPYGKQFLVVLSDGTRVHLNSGTTLKYPTKFITGINREVFLEGEAFFDVTKNTSHPFLVNSENLKIKVLGTKFNVTSYPENKQINTVLVEGSVEIFEKDNSKRVLLKPNQKASLHKKTKKLDVVKVGVEEYVAWREGKLILNEVLFEDILKKLERKYNVEFTNNNTTLKGRYFTAKFDKENINEVVQSLSMSASFSYSINGNQIIINP
ncbi:FecR family protein [Aquimarina sediminis]|uniref:FecR family protein n=1 Tax=Aquimarina sediminis TaxID=2070536 RepID=UPI000CA05A1C|nr:FecR family protein [Aquimarina sediminis]